MTFDRITTVLVLVVVGWIAFMVISSKTIVSDVVKNIEISTALGASNIMLTQQLDAQVRKLKKLDADEGVTLGKINDVDGIRRASSLSNALALYYSN